MHLGPGALRDLLPAITSDVPAQQGNLKPRGRCCCAVPNARGAGYQFRQELVTAWALGRPRCDIRVILGRVAPAIHSRPCQERRELPTRSWLTTAGLTNGRGRVGAIQGRALPKCC
jgi:hypothetical protein